MFGFHTYSQTSYSALTDSLNAVTGQEITSAVNSVTIGVFQRVFVTAFKLSVRSE